MFDLQSHFIEKINIRISLPLNFYLISLIQVQFFMINLSLARIFINVYNIKFNFLHYDCFFNVYNNPHDSFSNNSVRVLYFFIMLNVSERKAPHSMQHMNNMMLSFNIACSSLRQSAPLTMQYPEKFTSTSALMW